MSEPLDNNESLAKEEEIVKELNVNWVKVQKKTFVKWVNFHLKKRSLEVSEESLENDLRSGHFIELIEVLFAKTFPSSIKKKQKTRVAQIDCLSHVVKFIKSQGVRTTISAENILDGNEKEILALLWSLINHTLLLGIEDKDDASSQNKKGSAKAMILEFVQDSLQDVEGVNVTDFSTSFQDGRAFCALINSCMPDLIDMDSLDPNDPLATLKTAFETAEKELAIPQLLDPNHVMECPDEQSILTYVSYFNLYKKGKEREEAVKEEVKQKTEEAKKVEEEREAKLLELESELETTRNETTSLQHKLFEMEKTCEETELQREKLETALEGVQAQMGVIQKQNDEFEEKVETLKSELATKAQVADESAAKLVVVEEENSLLKSRYFSALMLTIKMNEQSQEREFKQVPMQALFEECLENEIPIAQWPSWIASALLPDPAVEEGEGEGEEKKEEGEGVEKKVEGEGEGEEKKEEGEGVEKKEEGEGEGEEKKEEKNEGAVEEKKAEGEGEATETKE